MKGKLHLYENPWEPETKTRDGREFFLTTSEVPGNAPEACKRCGELVAYWYEAPASVEPYQCLVAYHDTYCEDCTVVHEQRGE